MQALREYIALRGDQPGPLFRHPDGKPITRNYFCSQLRFDAIMAGLDENKIKSHSFRIRAATSATLKGINDDTIRT